MKTRTRCFTSFFAVACVVLLAFTWACSRARVAQQEQAMTRKAGLADPPAERAVTGGAGPASPVAERAMIGGSGPANPRAERAMTRGAGPANPPPRRAMTGGAGPADPPPYYRGAPEPITAPSIVAGQKAGIDVGDCAPDFQLQPIQPYADLKYWLGDQAPKRADDLVPLSKLVGKAPILLLFGSYT